jgi:solute carrier family 25 (mitochondrial phosphate transporter), member 23/24/25/41
MNPEGDVQISEDIIDGLGIQFFLDVLFGIIIRIAHPPKQVQYAFEPVHDEEDMLLGTAQVLPPQVELVDLPTIEAKIKKSESLTVVLMDYLPIPGYFVAGGLSGIVSRTATAPLDRLRVYLIAQTDSAQDAVHAAKSGNPIQAFKHGWGTLSNAMKELWRAGGIRSLYAGMQRTRERIRLKC